MSNFIVIIGAGVVAIGVGVSSEAGVGEGKREGVGECVSKV